MPFTLPGRSGAAPTGPPGIGGTLRMTRGTTRLPVPGSPVPAHGPKHLHGGAVSFRPSASARPAGVLVRPLLVLAAFLALSAFTAALLGCLVHEGRPSQGQVLAPSAPVHHHGSATPDSPGVPHPDDPCVLHLAPRGVPDIAAQRPAAFPVLFVVLLSLLAAVSPGPVRRRSSASPGTAPAGRRTRIRICCWRI